MKVFTQNTHSKASRACPLKTFLKTRPGRKEILDSISVKDLCGNMFVIIFAIKMRYSVTSLGPVLN